MINSPRRMTMMIRCSVRMECGFSANFLCKQTSSTVLIIALHLAGITIIRCTLQWVECKWGRGGVEEGVERECAADFGLCVRSKPTHLMEAKRSFTSFNATGRRLSMLPSCVGIACRLQHHPPLAWIATTTTTSSNHSVRVMCRRERRGAMNVS